MSLSLENTHWWEEEGIVSATLNGLEKKSIKAKYSKHHYVWNPDD